METGPAGSGVAGGMTRACSSCPARLDRRGRNKVGLCKACWCRSQRLDPDRPAKKRPQVQLTYTDRAYRAEKVVRLYRAGLSSRAVAAEIGLSGGYVRQVVRAAGVARRPGRPAL